MTYKIIVYLLLASGAISLDRVVLPSQKIVINLPRYYMKLPCKGEASVQWLARSFSTDTQTDRDPVTLLKGYETCRVLLQWYWFITTKQLKLDGYIIMPRFWN